MKFSFGFLYAVLFLIFLTCKLVGAITWSWLWVTALLWIPLAGLGFIVIALGLIGGLAYMHELGK